MTAGRLCRPLAFSITVVQGAVNAVGDESFTVDTGVTDMTVEVDEMPYNPVDDEGYLRIETGDLVRVTGDMDRDLFEGRVLEADSVVVIEN